MSPLISIVIPAKGDLEFFSQTLKSIHESTYNEFEVLIIDDGISKYALELITKHIYGRLNFRIVKNNGSGIVDAINTGIIESTGDYIARIDSDDCLLPERLQTQVDFLIEHPLVGVIGTQVAYLNQFGDLIGKSKYPIGSLALTTGDFRDCPIAHPSVMLRREILNKIENYQSFLKFKGREYAEDYYLWTRVATIAEIWNIDAPLTLYRQHPNQVSATNLHVTALAAELVYLKIYDLDDNISVPVNLDTLSEKMIRQYVVLGIRKIGLLFGMHLYSRFLLARSSHKLIQNILIIISKFTARVLRFIQQ